jgi:hypothetical protein
MDDETSTKKKVTIRLPSEAEYYLMRSTTLTDSVDLSNWEFGSKV